MPVPGTAAARRAARVRGREEDRKRLGLKITFDDLISLPADPPQYLEEQRAKHIRMLETIVCETQDPYLKARICFDLLRLSSLGSRKLDITARQSVELPDLGHLSTEDLERLIREAKGQATTSGNGPLRAAPLAITDGQEPT